MTDQDRDAIRRQIQQAAQRQAGSTPAAASPAPDLPCPIRDTSGSFGPGCILQIVGAGGAILCLAIGAMIDAAGMFIALVIAAPWLTFWLWLGNNLNVRYLCPACRSHISPQASRCPRCQTTLHPLAP